MRAYKAFEESGVEELGDITERQIPAFLDESVASQGGDNPFSLGVYRSEKDFMEIRPVGGSQYLIWSDCIVAKKGFLGGLLGKKHIEKIVESQAEAIGAVTYYIEQPREAFEQKYS